MAIKFLLSGLYYLGLKIHRKFSISKKLPFPVISVGNITLGGTGKTPAVEIVCRELLDAGWHPGILIRGYRRKKTSEPLIVSDGKNLLSNSEYSGDEPYLLARRLSGVPVIVGKNRYKSGLLLPALGADIAVLDDGFQHWGLKRDLDIVCLDATNPFGNGWVLPAGILREPASALSRADLILLNKINLVPEEKKEKLFKYLFEKFPRVLVIPVEYTVEKIVGKDGEVSVTNFFDREIILISGIARPESFEQLLSSVGIKFIRHFKFPDHHYFTEKELTEIFSRYPRAYFLTTEKDYVRIGTKYDRIFWVCLKLQYDRNNLKKCLPSK